MSRGHESDEPDTEDRDIADVEAPGGDEDPVEAHFDAVYDRVAQLRETTLAPCIAALEADRRKVRGAIRRSVAILAVPVAAFVLSDAIRPVLYSMAGDRPAARWAGDNVSWLVAALFLAALAGIGLFIVMPGVAALGTYRRRFTRELATQLFAAMVPGGRYQPDRHVGQAMFERSGIWPGPYRSFTGHDLIGGRVGSTEFEASALHAEPAATGGRKRKEDDEAGESSVAAFHGLFYHLRLDRTLEGHTIVEPEDAEDRGEGHRQGLRRITAGDENFNETFRVYTTHPAEAASLLTPRVCARLVTLAAQASSPPFVAFVGDHLFFATPTGRPAVEPSVATELSPGALSGMAEYFTMPEVLVRQIASPASSDVAGVPGVPERSATRPSGLALDAGVAHRRDEPVSARGFAGVVGQPADERDLALRPPPESRVRMAPLTGEGLTVAFGLTPSFFVRVAWTLGLTPFVAGGAARLAGAAGRPTLDALAARVPPVAALAEQAANWPVSFAAVSLLVYVLPTWGLLYVPSGLRISREGVRVSRRLWPMATVYALDRIAGVRVTDKQVLLERRHAARLRRYVLPAPPMQTREHARWLAAQMQRAIVMFGGLRPHA